VAEPALLLPAPAPDVDLLLMPTKMEQALKKSAHKKEREGTLKKENEGAYVYGTMRQTGWKPSREKN
jgi:hypothetical protein